MTPSPFPYSRKLVALVFMAAGLFAPSVAAADAASAWDSAPEALLRLIAAPARAAGTPLRAGIEIKLQPGWKTYWRYPGDSGVAPHFDFTDSTNVKNVSLLWPAPMRFSDGSGASIGYADHVILPLHVERGDPAKPAMLKLKLNYAVCEKLCVPVDGKAELAIPATDATQDEAIAASEARVPKPTTIGAQDALAITAVRRQSGPRPRVIVDVMVRDATQVDLFAEGPTPEWALPLPERISHGPDGLWRFAFDLDGLPPSASAQGAALTLTAVTPERAIELTVRLD